jgi:O-antigen/teichoic acid export membrane protein
MFGFAHEGAWIIFGQLATTTGALVLVRTLTNKLEPAQYGELALGLTLAGLVNQVVMGGVSNGIARFYTIAVEKKDLQGYVYSIKKLLTYATSAVIGIGIVLILNLYFQRLFQWIDLALYIILFSIASGFNSIFTSIQNAARQRVIVSFCIGLDAWLKIGLAVCFIIWIGGTSSAVVLGLACSSIILLVLQLYFLRTIIPIKNLMDVRKEDWSQKIWSYSLPFCTWGVFTWMQQASDRWALQFFAGSSDVGNYAVLYQLGFTPIALITNMAISFMAPILFQKSGDATDDNSNEIIHNIVWNMTYLTLIITVLGFMITLTTHKWLFSLLVSSNYQAVSYLLPWIVLAGGIFAAGQVIALKLMTEMKSSHMTRAKIITALLGVILNIIGALFAGIHGVVFTAVVFSSIYFIWMGMIGRDYFKNNK